MGSGVAGVLGGVGGIISAGADVAAANASRSTAYGLKDNGMQLAAPTAGEIANMQQMTNASNYNLQRQQAILNSVDPAIIEMGKQTLAMMSGTKEVGTNSVLRNQIDQQRQNLQSSLQQKLGSGWQTSTAGMQAMNNFEMQAANSLQTNQQNTINSYLGMMSPYAQNGVAQSGQMFATLGNMSNTLQGRQVNTLNAFSPNIMATEGNQYAGQKALGNTLSQLGGSAAAGGWFNSSPSTGGMATDSQWSDYMRSK